MGSQQDTDSKSNADSTESMPEQAGRDDADIATAGMSPRWKISTMDELIIYGLIVLSLIGAVISQVSVDLGRHYWLVMIPIMGIATVYVESGKVARGEVSWRTLILMQIFHWGSLVITVELVSLLAYFGRINNTAVSLMSLLLLAQTTFLVGVHRDWRFCIVAAFQTLCLIVLAYLETYIWLTIAVAIIIIVLGIYLHKKFPHISPNRRYQQ